MALATHFIKVVGFDPSLRNWGICVANVNVDTLALDVDQLQTISIKTNTNKSIRQNIKDLDVAQGLFENAKTALQGATFAFVEVPVGSQNARSMASYGVCVGVLGSLRSLGVPIIPVTPKEVKMAAVGKDTASKTDMIHWATNLYPKAPWPTYDRGGSISITNGKAEHMADAVAAIHAGLGSSEFMTMLQLVRSLQRSTKTCESI